MLRKVLQRFNAPLLEGKGIKVFRINEAKLAPYQHDRSATVEAFRDYHEIEFRADELSEETGRKVRSIELGFVQGMPHNQVYIGLFYTGRKPKKNVILTLIKKALKQHPDPNLNVEKAATCVLKGKSVYLDDGTGKYYCEFGEDDEIYFIEGH